MSPIVPPPVIAALVGLLMWQADRLLSFAHITWGGQLSLAAALLLIAFVLMVLAAVSFFKAKTTINPLRPARASQLVTSGVFRYSRNPIYLGDLLALLAFAIFLGNVFNLGFLCLFVVYLNRFQIAPEERALTSLFGEAYLDYCRRVRRWV